MKLGRFGISTDTQPAQGLVTWTRQTTGFTNIHGIVIFCAILRSIHNQCKQSMKPRIPRIVRLRTRKMTPTRSLAQSMTNRLTAVWRIRIVILLLRHRSTSSQRIRRLPTLSWEAAILLKRLAPHLLQSLDFRLAIRSHKLVISD